MYSQCPECLTRFRVTAAALRAARGTVRCGRCGIAFDALPRLADTLEDVAAASGAAEAPVALADATGHATGPAEDGTVVTEFHFSADDIEQVFVDARDWQRRFGETGPGMSSDDELAADLAAAVAADEAQRAAAESAPTAVGAVLATDVFVHEPESVEDITLEGERIVIEGYRDDEADAGDFVPGDDAERLPPPSGAVVEPDLDSTDQFEALRIQAAAAALAGDDAAAQPHGLPEDEFERQIERALQQSLAPVETVPESIDEPRVTSVDVDTPATPLEPIAAVERVVPGVHAIEPPRTAEVEDLNLDHVAAELSRSRGRRLAWGLGSLLLALVLAAQLVHHYRQELARHPVFGPPVRAVYSQLGLPLASNWDPAAFELQQWGASDPAPTPDGRLTIRASVRNRAGFAQPAPLLRLELEDRFGGTVARRDFEPREYLKDSAQATRLLAAGAATEAEIAIVDAARDAVGYRLDVCLRDETAAVRCAGDRQTETSP